jgi:hypothetical protein
MMTRFVAFAALTLFSASAYAVSAPDIEGRFDPPVDIGDEVDITSGAVTGLSCAQEALETGQIKLVQSCPLREAAGGIVIYDVVEEMIVQFEGGVVPRYKLEMAYGGGSVDVIGIVTKINTQTGVVTVEVDEVSITEKPKAGGFKGCL